MHRLLQELVDRTVELFQDDPRVLAAFHSGSVATEREDEYSDADPVFVVRPEAFEELDADLPEIFGGLCGDIHLWWPERGNCDTWRNYAILSEADGRVLQYDITIMKPPAGLPMRVPRAQLLFDKAGLVEPVESAPAKPYDPKRLLWTVERYWVYVYIHAKYLRRGDPFKLAFAQRELFQEHLEVLHALHGKAEGDWWPLVAGKVTPPGRQDDMLRYLERSDRASVAAALPRELDSFARDARAACARWGITYPEAVEEVVRKHLSEALGEEALPEASEESGQW